MDVALHNPVTACMAASQLFKQVDWPTIQLLAEEARLTRLERGQAVFQCGQQNNSLFLVKSGQVKLSLLAPTGSERVIDLVSAGETFGESLLFARLQSKLNAEMLTTGTLIQIPQAAVKQVLPTSPTLAGAMLRYLSTRICHLLDELENCCLRSARQRVVDYLLMLVKEQTDAERKRVQILLPASKGVTASLLDITPETFSRELNRLIGMGLIDVQRKRISIIDQAGLQQLSA